MDHISESQLFNTVNHSCWNGKQTMNNFYICVTSGQYLCSVL